MAGITDQLCLQKNNTVNCLDKTKMNRECIFCHIKKEEKIMESELAFVFVDHFPVSKHHSLIIPKRHFENFFDITNQELLEINRLLKLRKEQILAEDKTVTGFNIGINIGHDAGQTVFHLHVHLIPRRPGDVVNPKGGIRGVIPNKRSY